MTITQEDELERLKAIGRIVANVLKAMSEKLTPGITPRELDDFARRLLEREGARSAPELAYGFPAATCISVNEAIAHGIPSDRPLRNGDIVNIDVSAEKDGIFADNGGSFVVGTASHRINRLCRDGRRALSAGVSRVRANRPLAEIGTAIGKFADANGYTLVTNLASHGVGHTLHDEPGQIATWPDRSERRMISEGLVMAIEPFLSLGAREARDGDDEWTLYSMPSAPTVQFEHTVVATKSGPLIVTLPG